MADYFYCYKQALKSRYDLVKVGVNANYLLEPTTAKLRNLCMSYYRDNQITTDDKRVFQQFFGFEYDHAKKSEVSARTDRFKPIKTFLLNETDIAENNIAAAEMLAVLLDYELRPFRKFVAHNNHITV